MDGQLSSRSVTALSRTAHEFAGSDNSVVVVGNLDRWKAEGRYIPNLAGVAFISFAQLACFDFKKLSANMVISALFADDFDAIDVARKLYELGYLGRYRVVADALPNPVIIRSEVQSSAPGLDVDLMILPAAG